MKAELVRQELKHKKQWDELKSINIANEKELEQIQVCQVPISHVKGLCCLKETVKLEVESGGCDKKQL